MRRSSSANSLACLPRAPTLEKVVEDEVVQEEPPPGASVTKRELKLKEKLFQAMYYCARNDLGRPVCNSSNDYVDIRNRAVRDLGHCFDGGHGSCGGGLIP